jgi:hypothetical protein
MKIAVVSRFIVHVCFKAVLENMVDYFHTAQVWSSREKRILTHLVPRLDLLSISAKRKAAAYTELLRFNI